MITGISNTTGCTIYSAWLGNAWVSVMSKGVNGKNLTCRYNDEFSRWYKIDYDEFVKMDYATKDKLMRLYRKKTQRAYYYHKSKQQDDDSK